MHNFKELKIWERAIDLAERVNGATRNYPKEEQFGLTSQIRRSATSISANIAEGSGQISDKAFIRFLSIAHGSCYELQSHLTLSAKLGFIDLVECERLIAEIEEIQKMNYSLIKRLKGSLTS